MGEECLPSGPPLKSSSLAGLLEARAVSGQRTSSGLSWTHRPGGCSWPRVLGVCLHGRFRLEAENQPHRPRPPALPPEGQQGGLGFRASGRVWCARRAPQEGLVLGF